MDCPKCGYHNTLVIDSRNIEYYQTVRRRRECQKCGYRFTTHERILNDEIKEEKTARRAIERIKNIMDDYNEEVRKVLLS